MNGNSNTQDDGERTRQMVLLLTQHQRRIFSYIYTLVPDRHDAENILQETNLVICEKFAEFNQETNFIAWAFQIAWWRVRAARQKFARSKVVFDDAVLAAVSNTATELRDETDRRHEALEQCLGKLNQRDRELMLSRYEPGSGVEEAARRSGRSLVAAYKALGRIRKLLMDCVSNQFASEVAS